MFSFNALVHWRFNRFWACLGVIAIGLGFAEERLYGQTASTGAVTGVTLANNVFGISEDRAQLAGICLKSQLISAGPVGSKLDSYFNKSCFMAPLIIGADGIGMSFGNRGTGIVDGPSQANLDFAISKTLFVPWPREKSSVEFRAELFNAFNHPHFANPDPNFSSPTFGVISSTSVNARVGQLALRFSF